jgi:hypothetical protein
VNLDVSVLERIKMSDITPSFIRGFIAPFRFTSEHYWSTQSSVTQNGDLAGVAEPSEGADLAILAKGTQTQTVEIETQRAGHVTDNAGFVWKYDGDNRHYGLEVPNKVMDVRNLVSTTIHENTPRDAVRLSSGTVLIAYENKQTIDIDVRIARLDVDGTVSTSFISTNVIADLNSNELYPAVCELSDGSALCAVWNVDGVAEVANISIYRSTDDGKTWTKVSSRALTDDVDIAGAYGAGASGFKLQPLTLSANNHQVLLFTALYAHNTSLTYGTIMKQHASTNGGLQYTFIDESEAGDASYFYKPKVVEHNGVFVIAYISDVDTISFTRLEDATTSVFDTLGTIAADTLSANLAVGSANRLEDGDYTFYKDTDGRLYIYACNLQNNEVLGAYSDLMGIGVESYASTWYNFGDEFNFDDTQVAKFYSTSAGGGVQNVVGAPGQGEQLLFCNYNNIGTNTYDDSLIVLILGGWSTQQYPRLQPYPNDNQWGYDTQVWVPFDLPDQNSVWTKGGLGLSTTSLDGDHITLSVISTNTVQYYQTPTDKTNGIMLHTRVSNISGGSTTDGITVGARIQQTTSTQTYYVEVVLNDDAVYVYDGHTSSLIGSATGLSFIDGTQILLHLDNSDGKVFVYYADAGSPRQYLQISGTCSLDASTLQRVFWGIPTGSGARSADFHFFAFGTGDSNGLRWEPNDLNARQYTARGFYTTLKEGLQISTSAGAAREGDTYTIKPQYGAPVQRTLHTVSPSPSVGWRSNAVTNPDVDLVPSQTIAWMLDTTLQGTDDTHIISEAVGVHLTDINFKSFTISKYASGSWTSVATVDNSVGGSFNFSRKGAAIFSTDADGVYLHLNECRGWSVRLQDGEGAVVVRRIATNGDGVFASTTSKRAYLQLEDVKTTDPTSGTAHLIPDACTVLLNQNDFAALRIEIATDKSAEGWYQIGTMVMGPVIITSPQYGRGRTVEFSANVLESESSNGTLYTRKQGKGGRIVRIAWTDGVDTSALNADPANPDYYNLYAGSPIAAANSAPTGMMGLVNYLDGAREAVVYLPALETLPGTHITLNRYHEHMLCTLGNSMQIDHVIGDELLDASQGEVFRVATILLREVR